MHSIARARGFVLFVVIALVCPAGLARLRERRFSEAELQRGYANRSLLAKPNRARLVEGKVDVTAKIVVNPVT